MNMTKTHKFVIETYFKNDEDVELFEQELFEWVSHAYSYLLKKYDNVIGFKQITGE